MPGRKPTSGAGLAARRGPARVNATRLPRTAWSKRPPPVRRELTALQHGLPRTQANVRLFLVPGMHHCSGGPAPDHLPLCPYPLQARFRGAGDVAEAANWRCRPGPAK